MQQIIALALNLMLVNALGPAGLDIQRIKIQRACTGFASFHSQNTHLLTSNQQITLMVESCLNAKPFEY